MNTVSLSHLYLDPMQSISILNLVSFSMGQASSHVLDSLMEGTNFDRDEIDRLRKRFMKLDSDGSGTIDKQEFLAIPGILSNPLASRLMDVFDEDGSGTIDFQEFIQRKNVQS